MLFLFRDFFWPKKSCPPPLADILFPLCNTLNQNPYVIHMLSICQLKIKTKTVKSPQNICPLKLKAMNGKLKNAYFSLFFGLSKRMLSLPKWNYLKLYWNYLLLFRKSNNYKYPRMTSFAISKLNVILSMFSSSFRLNLKISFQFQSQESQSVFNFCFKPCNVLIL